MKHPFLLAFLFFSIVVKAQETESSGRRGLGKGQYIIGLYGSGGFNNSPVYKHPKWALSPWAGYFVGNNLATGLRMSFGKDAMELKSGSTGNIWEYNHKSVAPEVFVRYYAPGIKIKPFVQVAAGYNFQWGETENTEGQMQKVKDSHVIGSVEGGIRFPVGKKLSIDAAYNWRFSPKSVLNDANEKGRIRLGLSFRL
ncbi:MAG: outer membrane beta-barrel protein [Leadbetterella sp.]|nr:outer membrane beta-barrel protein [Leadbetterella sp.]